MQKKSPTSPPSDTNPAENVAYENLVAFCERLQHTYRQIRTLTGTERSHVDKTLAKASRYELLQKISNPGAIPCYSAQQTERIQIECLHEINSRLIASGELVRQIVDDCQKLLRSYQELEQASRKLDWTRTSCSLITGSEKRKPLEYYLQEGYRITFQVNGFVARIRLVFNAVDIRQVGSIQKFRDCLKISEELDLYLREFLAYVVFIC